MARRRRLRGWEALGVLLLLVIYVVVEYPGVALALALLALGAGLLWQASRRRREVLRVEQLSGRSLEEIDTFSGGDFEAWVTAVLQSAGIPAENIRDQGDFGIDVIATLGSVRVGIQVKRYAKSVGNDAVQQALAGSAYHGCGLAAVVTQSRYTRAARAQASRGRVPVLLVDREGLHELADRLREFSESS